MITFDTDIRDLAPELISVRGRRMKVVTLPVPAGDWHFSDDVLRGWDAPDPLPRLWDGLRFACPVCIDNLTLTHLAQLDFFNAPPKIVYGNLGMRLRHVPVIDIRQFGPVEGPLWEFMGRRLDELTVKRDIVTECCNTQLTITHGRVTERRFDAQPERMS